MPTTMRGSIQAYGSGIVTVKPTDDEGTEAKPTAASWSVYRGGSIVNGLKDESIPGDDLAVTMEIVLSGDDLPPGTLYFVLKYTYTSTLGTDLPGRDWIGITVAGVPGVDQG